MSSCGSKIAIHSSNSLFSTLLVIFIALIVFHEQQTQTAFGFMLQELPLYAEVVRKHNILQMTTKNGIVATEATNNRRRHRRKQRHGEVLIRLI